MQVIDVNIIISFHIKIFTRKCLLENLQILR